MLRQKEVVRCLPFMQNYSDYFTYQCRLINTCGFGDLNIKNSTVVNDMIF